MRKSNKYTMNVDSIRVPYGSHTMKYPSHPQAETSQCGKKADVWTPHPGGAKPKDVIEIPVTCNGMSEKTPHPTQKPEELLRSLILASTNSGDLIFDPFSGSGTSGVASRQLGRLWMGSEINSEYNQWAIKRFNSVCHISENYWIEYDRKNMLRRKSIR